MYATIQERILILHGRCCGSYDALVCGLTPGISTTRSGWGESSMWPGDGEARICELRDYRWDATAVHLG